MKEIKKKYIKPEMKSYELKSMQPLLIGSAKSLQIDYDEEEYEGEFN